MKKYISYLPLAALLLVACQTQDTRQIPDTLPDVHGNITNLKKTNAKKDAAVAVVLVEAVEGIKTNHTKASLRIDNKTLIEGQDGAVLKLEQLREGQLVEVWFGDPVMESFPVQAHAAAIRVSNY
jgi:hypothetical protein